VLGLLRAGDDAGQGRRRRTAAPLHPHAATRTTPAAAGRTPMAQARWASRARCWLPSCSRSRTKYPTA
jgi:hypothetical protein